MQLHRWVPRRLRFPGAGLNSGRCWKKQEREETIRCLPNLAISIFKLVPRQDGWMHMRCFCYYYALTWKGKLLKNVHR